MPLSVLTDNVHVSEGGTPDGCDEQHTDDGGSHEKVDFKRFLRNFMVFKGVFRLN